MSSNNTTAFLDSIHTLPMASIQADTSYWWDEWHKTTDDSEEYAILMQHPQSKPLIEHLFVHSPFLARLVVSHPLWFTHMCLQPLNDTIEQLYNTLDSDAAEATNKAELMSILRIAKQRLALLTAAADVVDVWRVKEVTHTLSLFAERSTQIALTFLLTQQHEKGELALEDVTNPFRNCGIIVLAMGKLGAYELNYSSDIDLIILFDREIVPYSGKHNDQHCCSRIAQELMSILHDRTADGYVFRTDLRLRPDPSSTPLAISVAAALAYYETVGQNWERAAMIKARFIAGDAKSGASYLKAMQPFIWRRHLDFAAIEDIQSIKRQMHSNREVPADLYEHNIKLGVGGIREIEFLAQVHQLIWGGRYPDLRSQPTIDTLRTLAIHSIITAEQSSTLIDSYLFLREIEHHLQMIDDQQTHTLPSNESGFRALASFMAQNYDNFVHNVHETLIEVHAIYGSVLPSSAPLSADGNLVFTGVDHDPDTLKTLRNMGYSQTESISGSIMGWHRANRRATRSKRSRQLLTELMPIILKELATTAKPDAAFARFDDFLAKLPAGIQLFSLINAKPHLMGLIATIMGSAPALADTLSKYPHLLEAVLQADFFTALPSVETMRSELEERLAYARDIEEAMDLLRIFKGEKQFQAGMQMLRQGISPATCSLFLSELAEIVLHAVLSRSCAYFAETYGTVPGGKLAIVAMGRLGARELTFGSDLDLIFLYDTSDIDAQSDGERSIDVKLYYQRLCQRIITGLSSLMRHGILYEIDARLRPAGNDSPLAIHLDTFEGYMCNSAWTFERMALTRARVVASESTELSTKIDVLTKQAITYIPKNNDILKDVQDMHARVHQEFRTKDVWEIKHVHGGLMDIDFIAQYLALKYANDHADFHSPSSDTIFNLAMQHCFMEEATANELTAARDIQMQLLSYVRLCSNKRVSKRDTPLGLQRLLCKALHVDSLIQLESRLQRHQEIAAKHFANLALY